MKALELTVLSLVVLSGYDLAEGTSLNTVKEYMATWNAHDASRAAQFLADDVVYHDATAGEPVSGKEKAEKGVIGAFIKAVPDLSQEMVGKPVYDEDTVAFRREFSGKNSSEWVGSPPINSPIKFEGISYIHVRAGKITWQGDYYDSKKLGEELKPVGQSAIPLYK